MKWSRWKCQRNAVEAHESGSLERSCTGAPHTWEGIYTYFTSTFELRTDNNELVHFSCFFPFAFSTHLPWKWSYCYVFGVFFRIPSVWMKITSLAGSSIHDIWIFINVYVGHITIHFRVASMFLSKQGFVWLNQKKSPSCRLVSKILNSNHGCIYANICVKLFVKCNVNICILNRENKIL